LSFQERVAFERSFSSFSPLFPSQIVTVHTPTGKVTEVLFPPAAIEILMVDPSTDTLLAWNANSEYAALLQDLNATTGKTSPVFTASLDLSANGGKSHPRACLSRIALHGVQPSYLLFAIQARPW
jgi:hypothetical protein